MHLQSKATVIFVDSLKYLREEFDTVGGSSETRRSFFRWRGHELPSSNFSERLPTPPSLLAPGFNPIFALTTNPLASSCQSALPPVVSWFKVQFIVMSYVLHKWKKRCLLPLSQRTFLGVFWRTAQNGWRMFLQTSRSAKQQRPPAQRFHHHSCA